MKICAITMVYRDYWALSQWYAHYGRHLGEDNLFVVAHGSDPMVQTLCPKATVTTITRGSLEGFDQIRGLVLDGLRDVLGQDYDWVIQTDTDELICLDPSEYASFKDLLTRQDAPVLFATGLNVVEMDAEVALEDGDTALSKRSNAVFSGHYSKAWAVHGQAVLKRHGVEVARSELLTCDYVMPKGVYLAHLKFANRAALVDANAHRRRIARSGGKGLPGKAWRHAGTHAGRFLRKVADLPLIEWDEGLTMAQEKLQTPIRDMERELLRSQSHDFDFRTVLPDWFKTC